MLKIKTTKLQEMLARAVQGASENKLIPLTNLLAIELKDSKLTITSTDKVNYLYVIEEVAGDDFYVCVSVDKFPKLIARLTCEDVTLDLKDNYLEVVGNGKYQIDFQLDESGEMVRFPNPLKDFDNAEKVGEIELTTVKTILDNIRPALATKGREQYFNYFVGNVANQDTVIATDTNKISALKTSIFTDKKARLISAEMMNLLDTMIDDKIEILALDNKVMFRTAHEIVYGYTPDGVDKFNAEAIAGYLEKEYKSSCKISKIELLQVLERISLFVDYLDNDVILLSFDKEGLTITNRKSNGSETLAYIESNNAEAFSGIVLLDRLRTQIKSQTGDSIDIYFGEEKALKFVDNNSIFVVALGSE